MTGPESVLAEFDDAFRPYLPLLGAIAVDAARIEFGLALLRSMLTNDPTSDTLNAYADRNVGEIKNAARSVDAARVPYATPVVDWATQAERMLSRRGDLMHSMWSVGSDVTPADLVRIGWLTPQEAAAIHPTGERPVYSDRIRGNELTITWTARAGRIRPRVARAHVQVPDDARSGRDRGRRMGPVEGAATVGSADMDQDASLYNGSGVFYRLAIAQQRGAEDMAAQAADGGGPPGERHNREIDACMAVLTFLQAALETHIFWVYRLAGLEARRQWRLKWTDVGAVAVAKGLPDVALPGEHAETLNEISDWRNYLLHGDDEARRRLASRLDTSGDPVPHQHLSAAYTADRPRIYVWAWRQER